MNKTHIKRLRTVAAALDEADAIPFFRKTFTMRVWGFGFNHERQNVPDCGTPACAMGHYAARTDLQRGFKLDSDGDVATTGHLKGYRVDFAMRMHFGIDVNQHEKLFGHDGCNRAKRPKAAASYIRKFASAMETQHGLA